MIGFLNVYKPSGMTSQAVVSKIKKRFNIKKIGHMGTLDPLACGILPIAVGKATRLFDYSLKKDKVYRVIYEFGYTTDTLDKDGVIINSNGNIPSQEDIRKSIAEMVGKCNQLPPNFSAKRINGKRAYELAREGVEFALKPKEIEIYSFDFVRQIDDKSFEFVIKCSSGTYIRAIGRDLSEKLNTYACMVFLERQETGVFKKDSSYPLDEILEKDLSKYLLSPLQVFPNFDKISIDESTCTDLLNGKSVKFSAIKKDSFVLYGDKLIGVAKIDNNYLRLNTYLGD